MKYFLACLISLAFTSAIADTKRLFERYPGAGKECQRGQAMAWVVTCDPGSRAPIDRAWNPRLPGAEVCRARAVGCQAIQEFNTAARPGFEVQDSTSAGELALVTFGLGSLLGEEP